KLINSKVLQRCGYIKLDQTSMGSQCSSIIHRHHYSHTITSVETFTITTVGRCPFKAKDHFYTIDRFRHTRARKKPIKPVDRNASCVAESCSKARRHFSKATW
ncbi:hypothetical protein GCK32_011625, partial [Trichostrongylus colubriformis]